MKYLISKGSPSLKSVSPGFWSLVLCLGTAAPSFRSSATFSVFCKSDFFLRRPTKAMWCLLLVWPWSIGFRWLPGAAKTGDDDEITAFSCWTYYIWPDIFLIFTAIYKVQLLLPPFYKRRSQGTEKMNNLQRSHS